MVNVPFGQRAWRALRTRGPLCVGIDPHSGSLDSWGLKDDIGGAEYFSLKIVEALAEEVAFLKPQSAFFERFGAAGIALLERVLAEASAAGAHLILDVKRGDIGTTMRAYAQAYLDPGSPLAADAITVNPFLGVGALEPAMELAAAHNRGLFVLALTSNPEGRDVQHAYSASGTSVAQHIIDEIASHNAHTTDLGSVGAVVGATVGDHRAPGTASQETASYPGPHVAVQTGETGHDLCQLNGPILVPGMGAQGGRPEDLPRVLGAAVTAAIPAYSREIAGQGPSIPDIRRAAMHAMHACHDVIWQPD